MDSNSHRPNDVDPVVYSTADQLPDAGHPGEPDNNADWHTHPDATSDALAVDVYGHTHRQGNTAGHEHPEQELGPRRWPTGH